MSSILKDQEFDDFFDVEEEETVTHAEKYLLFNLADELYGINIINVIEIIEMQRITEVPDMPDFIRGVINLRGKVIPVMDLRLRFGMEEREYDDRNCIIVSKIDNASLGLIVDTVAEVHDILTSDIEQAPNFSNNGGENYIEGIGKVDNQIAVLIDAHMILHGKDLTMASNLTKQGDQR
jgi:purine-binding chemotaxis protein CheW